LPPPPPPPRLRRRLFRPPNSISGILPGSVRQARGAIRGGRVPCARNLVRGLWSKNKSQSGEAPSIRTEARGSTTGCGPRVRAGALIDGSPRLKGAGDHHSRDRRVTNCGWEINVGVRIGRRSHAAPVGQPFRPHPPRGCGRVGGTGSTLNPNASTGKPRKCEGARSGVRCGTGKTRGNAGDGPIGAASTPCDTQ